MEFEPDYVTLTTDNIQISACQALFDDEDDFCGYYLKIENNSDAPIVILGKDFNLTDENGNNHFSSDHTFGGEILELNPGEYFEFEDTLELNTNSGVLYGTCQISKQPNDVQSIKIPALQLFSNKPTPFVLN